MILTERYQGSMLGMAVGDAVGTTLEFRPPGSFEPVTEMIGGGPFHLRPGQWTDDTSMALCLAASLVETQQFDPLDQIERYVRWWRHGYMSSTGSCFDIGNTVRAALSRFETTGDPYSGSTDPHSAGNGSIMRLAPVPLAFSLHPEQAIIMSANSSRTTHGTAACLDACRYLGGLIVGALQGVQKVDLLAPGYTPDSKGWQSAPLVPAIEAIAAGSFKTKQPPHIRGTGYVVHSLEAALWAFYHSDSFREGVLLAANLGDDADTTAAVFGQLAGAYYGVHAIPPTWRQQVAKRELILNLADGLYELAAHLAPCPIPDSYWVTPQLLAGEYPGHQTEAAGRARLQRFLNAGISCFIDLTRQGELNPYHQWLPPGTTYHRLPIQDLSIPTVPEMKAYLKVVSAMLEAGERVYVHCWGGVGRTATLIGCYLAENGYQGQEAINRIQHLRHHTPKASRPSPETPQQEHMVISWRQNQPPA